MLHFVNMQVAATTPSFIPSSESIALQIDDPYRHRSPRIEGEVLEAERAIKVANTVIEWMGQDAEATDLLRHPQAGGEGEDDQRTRDTSSLMTPIDRELAQQNGRQRIGQLFME